MNVNLKSILELATSIAKERVLDQKNFNEGIATKLVDEAVADPTLAKKMQLSYESPVDFLMGVEVGIILANKQRMN